MKQFRRITALLLIVALLFTMGGLADESLVAELAAPQEEAPQELLVEEEAAPEVAGEPEEQIETEEALPAEDAEETASEPVEEPEEQIEAGEELLVEEAEQIAPEPGIESTEAPAGEPVEGPDEIAEGKPPAVLAMGEMESTAGLLDAASATSGTCGSGVKWTLEGTKLIISGKGKMDDYPWRNLSSTTFLNKVETVVVKGGVTSIGAHAFLEFTALTTVKLAEGVQEIGRAAFAFCDRLKTVYIPQSLKYVHRYAFRFSRGYTIYYAGDEEQFNQILYDKDDDPDKNGFVYAPIKYAYIDWTPTDDPDFEDGDDAGSGDVDADADIRMGKLQAADAKKKTVKIDGDRYSVKQNFANSMRALLKNSKIKDKTVVYKLKNGAISSVYSLYDVVKVKVQSREKKTDLNYWRGLYSKKRLESVPLTLKIVAMHYNEEDLEEAGVSLTIDKLQFKSDSTPYFYFEEASGDSKKKVKTLKKEIPDITLSFSSPTYELDAGPLIVNTKKAPKAPEGKTMAVRLTMTPHYASNSKYLDSHRSGFRVYVAVWQKNPDSASINSEDGVYKGTLMGASTAEGAVMIDNVRYVATQSFAKSMKELLKDKKVTDKTVVYRLKNRVLRSVYSVYDVAKVEVVPRIQTDEKDNSNSNDKDEDISAVLTYEDDEYKQSRLDQVELTLRIVPVKDEKTKKEIYSASELADADVSLKVDKLALQTDSKPYFYFEKSGVLSKKNVKKMTIDAPRRWGEDKWLLLKFNNALSKTCDLDIGPLVVNTEVKPKKKETDVELSLTPLYVGNAKTIKSHRSAIKLRIENLDIKNAKAKAESAKEKIESERESLQSELETSLSASTKIALGDELRQCLEKHYGSAVAGDMINTIQQYLMIYITEVPLMEETKTIPGTWAEKMQAYLKKSTTKALKKLKDSLYKKALSKMGLNSNVIMHLTQETLKTSVKIEETYVDFEIKLLSLSHSNKTPFTSQAEIKFSVRGEPYKGVGIFTFTDMENFANVMLDFLKIAYDTAWGTKADKIANALVAHPYDKLLFGKGTFSGKIFNLSVDAAKESVKKK